MRNKNFIIGLILCLIFACLFYVFLQGESNFWTYLSVWLIIGLSYNLIALGTIKILDYFYPWKNTPNRIWINIAAFTVTMLIASIFISYLETFAWNRNLSFEDYISSRNYRFKILGYYLVSLLITAIFHGIHLYKKLILEGKKNQKLVEMQHKNEIQSLKNQLDPHFLFNNFSVLHSLISESPEKAKNFTEKLSSFYRENLNALRKEKRTLAEELNAAQHYYSILKIKFGDAIHLTVKKPLSESRLLIPLSLQLALENAVKHNKTMASNPLHITIYEDGDNLVIENNLQPKSALNSNGVGLQNLSKHYELYGKQIQVLKENNRFTLILPYL